MGATWKDKQKSDRPKPLKNQHKASRQFARGVKNYVPVIDEDEEIDLFKATEEEMKDYEEYLANQNPQDFIED